MEEDEKTLLDHPRPKGWWDQAADSTRRLTADLAGDARLRLDPASSATSSRLPNASGGRPAVYQWPARPASTPAVHVNKMTVIAGCPRRFGREVHFVFAFDMDGGPAHSRQYAGPPAALVKKQYKVPAGPTTMTHVFAPKCTLYGF